MGQAQSGTLAERNQALVTFLLERLEKEWLQGRPERHVVARVMKLRGAILVDMVNGTVTAEERARRWGCLADTYLLQQLACYPPDYLAGSPPADRLLETVERFEEDLTDRVRPHYPWRAVVTIGEAIPVGPTRERGLDDPVMTELERQLKTLLGIAP